jgi:hypothetical protein
LPALSLAGPSVNLNPLESSSTLAPDATMDDWAGSSCTAERKSTASSKTRARRQNGFLFPVFMPLFLQFYGKS